MKTLGRANAKWNIEEEVKKKNSWVHLINWDEIVPSMPFATEYPKGTPTTTKSICYAQYINNIFEQIQMHEKHRFKTNSEIIRCAMHLGTYILYKVFVEDKGRAESGNSKFFFEALRSLEEVMTISQIVSTLIERNMQIKESIKKGTLTDEQGRSAIQHLYASVPKKYEGYVRDALTDDDRLEASLSKRDFSKLLKGIPEREGEII